MSTHEEQVQPVRGKVQVGDSAPDFTLPDQSGKPVSLGEFLGKTAIRITWDACYMLVKR